MIVALVGSWQHPVPAPHGPWLRASAAGCAPVVMRVEDVVELEGPACMQIVKMCANSSRMALCKARHAHDPANNCLRLQHSCFWPPQHGQQHSEYFSTGIR